MDPQLGAEIFLIIVFLSFTHWLMWRAGRASGKAQAYKEVSQQALYNMNSDYGRCHGD